ncbi:hypothetical protein [Variovorax sp. GT1P44]|uniref:hypothetical protein n=1 Tax=Variovorax sp. GT1P44 TaxID=3443742 RepID=UPI003F4602C5
MDGGNALSPYTSALLHELKSEQSSLWAAVSQASTRVVEATQGRQRPFISSDMNGDLYLRRRSPTRKLRAMVVGVGKLGAVGIGDIRGVYLDIEAWKEFLTECGFQVTLLADPTKAEFMAALQQAQQLASAPQRAPIRPVGLLLEGQGDRGDHEPAKDALVAIIYSGFGFRQKSERFLAVGDTVLSAAKDAINVDSAVSVEEVERALRRSVAASLLILDTNFI